MVMKSIAFIRSNVWNPRYGASCGTHNGYVAIPPTNKYYNMSLDELNEEVGVHGGVTWFETAANSLNILVEAECISADTKISEIGDDWKIVGFDTMHWGDNNILWNKTAVIKETLDLQRQLEEE